MTGPRQPRSKLYDGAIYGAVVERLLSGVHGFVAKRIPDGDRVLDACCGTGSVARRLARTGRTVVGVDLSPRNVAHARRRASAEGLGEDRVKFEVADVSQLATPKDDLYDVAIVVLALHEMPADARVPVLLTLARVAKSVMIVDFAVPMPWNFAGLRNRAMEIAAGAEHFLAFRDFTGRGGIDALVSEAGLVVESERRIDAGTLHVAVVSSPERGADG